MKTHFASILKIKKQELDNKEAKIAKINKSIADKFEAIAQFELQMKELLLPESGTFQDFRILQEHKKAFLFQIDLMHLEISNLKEERKQQQEQYRQAYIEYEKMHYIYSLELKKKTLATKKLEAKNADEITNNLFYFKDKK